LDLDPLHQNTDQMKILKCEWMLTPLQLEKDGGISSNNLVQVEQKDEHLWLVVWMSLQYQHAEHFQDTTFDPNQIWKYV
jgi:hypothetical protein